MKKSTPIHCPLCNEKLSSLNYVWVCPRLDANPFTNRLDYHYDFQDQGFRTHERVIENPNMMIIYTSDEDMNYGRLFFVEDGKEIEKIIDFPIDISNIGETMKHMRMDSEILK